MNLCTVLKKYRWAMEITIREMAKEIGCSPATLSRIENGETPSGAVLAKILVWLLQEPAAEDKGI